MSGLHAPTIPSGPTSARATNGDAKHLSFTELQRKKENLELELKALGSVLESVCVSAVPPSAVWWLTLATAWSRHEHPAPDTGWLPSSRYRCCTE
jgi:hypothetical protein